MTETSRIYEKLHRCSTRQVRLWSFSFLFPFLLAHAQEHPHAVSMHGAYITSTQIFTSPLSNNQIEKNTATALGEVLNFRGCYSYLATPTVRLQLSFELISAKREEPDKYQTVIVDGFQMYVSEFCAHFILPFTGSTFEIYIGGGGGVYWGERQYQIGNARARAAGSTASFNILTVIGVEYHLTRRVSLVGEWMFRDPMVTTTNFFEQPTVFSNGIYYPLDQRSFPSKINVNGNTYSLGVAVHF